MVVVKAMMSPGARATASRKKPTALMMGIERVAIDPRSRGLFIELESRMRIQGKSVI